MYFQADRLLNLGQAYRRLRIGLKIVFLIPFCCEVVDYKVAEHHQTRAVAGANVSGDK
ncbi:hypothetical protein Hanom_Chr07g00601561 [Helianthus anomalus]